MLPVAEQKLSVDILEAPGGCNVLLSELGLVLPLGDPPTGDTDLTFLWVVFSTPGTACGVLSWKFACNLNSQTSTL